MDTYTHNTHEIRKKIKLGRNATECEKSIQETLYFINDYLKRSVRRDREDVCKNSCFPCTASFFCSGEHVVSPPMKFTDNIKEINQINNFLMKKWHLTRHHICDRMNAIKKHSKFRSARFLKIQNGFFELKQMKMN